VTRLLDQSASTGQWFRTDDAQRWWFDSGSLALDFAYTGGMGEPGRWEQLHGASDLSDWLGQRYTNVGEATERDLADALTLRAAIASLARAASDGAESRADDVDTVNLFAATPDIPPALDGGHRHAGRSRVRVGQALSTIARDAVQLLSHNTEGRIRECDADNCALVFYDESRTNNRRWCSMQRCGNRAKVRAFRAKEKP
jgi:predicted RNA-binding Zn ribbon-like protein